MRGDFVPVRVDRRPTTRRTNTQKVAICFIGYFLRRDGVGPMVTVHILLFKPEEIRGWHAYFTLYPEKLVTVACDRLIRVG